MNFMGSSGRTFSDAQRRAMFASMFSQSPVSSNMVDFSLSTVAAAEEFKPVGRNLVYSGELDLSDGRTVPIFEHNLFGLNKRTLKKYAGYGNSKLAAVSAAILRLKEQVGEGGKDKVYHDISKMPELKAAGNVGKAFIGEGFENVSGDIDYEIKDMGDVNRFYTEVYERSLIDKDIPEPVIQEVERIVEVPSGVVDMGDLMFDDPGGDEMMDFDKSNAEDPYFTAPYYDTRLGAAGSEEGYTGGYASEQFVQYDNPVNVDVDNPVNIIIEDEMSTNVGDRIIAAAGRAGISRVEFEKMVSDKKQEMIDAAKDKRNREVAAAENARMAAKEVIDANQKRAEDSRREKLDREDARAEKREATRLEVERIKADAKVQAVIEKTGGRVRVSAQEEFAKNKRNDELLEESRDAVDAIHEGNAIDDAIIDGVSKTTIEIISEGVDEQ